MIIKMLDHNQNIKDISTDNSLVSFTRLDWQVTTRMPATSVPTGLNNKFFPIGVADPYRDLYKLCSGYVHLNGIVTLDDIADVTFRGIHLPAYRLYRQIDNLNRQMNIILKSGKFVTGTKELDTELQKFSFLTRENEYVDDSLSSRVRQLS